MRLTKWLMPRRSWSLDGMRRGMDDAVHILGFGIYFALGHMKKFAANLIIALGVAVALAGLVSIPLVRDYLPVSFMLPADGQTIHHYQAVLDDPQSQNYVPYIALLIGVITLAIGVLLRRKFRGNAA